MSETPEANPADVQEQQQTPAGEIPQEGGPDLDRLERDLGREVGVGSPREDHEVLLGRLQDAGHAWACPSVELSVCRVVAAASSAALAVLVPARARATQPSMLR